MAEADVPNYIAWNKIYPYCPLTQVEGEDKPKRIPPRGFTPSSASKVPTPTNVKDMDRVKRDVIDGLVETNIPQTQSIQVLHNNASKKIKQSIMEGIPNENVAAITARQAEQRAASSRDARSRLSQFRINSPAKPQLQRSKSMISTPGSHFEQDIPRKVLDMKMLAPDVWYTGRTPTHTPTPDLTLPVKAGRDWVKHFSPKRVRHFLTRAAADCRS